VLPDCRGHAGRTGYTAAHYCRNRRARYDYFIEERLEAGLALEGWEVKAMRAGRAQLAEAYVYIRNSEAFLIGAHIAPLNTVSTHKIADPVRTRKLLLNRRELDHLTGAVSGAATLSCPWRCTGCAGAPSFSSVSPREAETRQARHGEDRDWQRDRARLLRRG